jgi:hypothetical protein
VWAIEPAGDCIEEHLLEECESEVDAQLRLQNRVYEIRRVSVSGGIGVETGAVSVEEL